MKNSHESPNCQFPTINVDAIYENRKDANSPNKTLQLRWKVQEQTKGSILSQFLVGGMESKGRVAFQTMHEDKIAEWGVAVGDNLNEKIATPVRLTITDLVESDVAALEPKEQRGYKAKMNPKSKMYLYDENGEAIYRNISITGLDAQDTILSHSNESSVVPTDYQHRAVEEEDFTVESNVRA